ncbi:MAG: aspartate--ammonia ligase [Bacilli bacterium]|jgi:aspartate--ammonia ligase|nr:aspartate--ammonia ligase [Bacilli bacterium]
MYQSKLNLIETEIAIKFIKDEFERKLAKALNLIRVSSPVIVSKASGINDYLNGYEKPVSFSYENEELEIIQSLAKWKRMALKRYGFKIGRGLYADMNAIRKDEIVDSIHSIYVDQWDWEKIISSEQRTKDYLFDIVDIIYDVLKKMEKATRHRYPSLQRKLPKSIYCIDTQELENRFPDLSSKERELRIVKEHKAVFVFRIGGLLKSKTIHDGRSPDYDDWNLNGDILLYDALNNAVLEVSSMGIRVDEHSLVEQLKERNALDRLQYPYHQALLNKQLPLTIGGGIGQSRICQFFLEKKHIGEVQASYWPQDILDELKKESIIVL